MRFKLMSCVVILTLLFHVTVLGEVKDKPVMEITLLNGPQRTVYDVGEDVDLYGMRVRVVFTDGEEYVAGYSDLTYEGYNPQQEGSQLLIAKYGEYSVPFSVTVKKGTLRGISIRLKGNDGVWIAGQSIGKSNFTVTAEYDTGSSREVTDYLLSTNQLVAGRNIITVTYQDQKAQAVIDARENICQSIRIENPGTSEFLVGEPFNWNGLKVVAHFLDGTEVNVTSDCRVTGANTGREGRQYVEVKYETQVATYPVEVINMIFDKLDVSKWDETQTVDIYYKNHKAPITVGTEGVYISDDNTSGIRTFVVSYAGKSYQTTVEIPKEDRKYINSKRVLLAVPVGVTLITNEEGDLGYIPKTSLQSKTDVSVSANITPQTTIPRLSGLPTTLRLAPNSFTDLVLDIPNDKYTDSKTKEYYRLDVELEVN